MTIDTRLYLSTCLLVAAACAASAVEAAPAIWDGPRITFEYEGNTDPDAWMLPESQDRVTENVWIKRGTMFGLFNAAVEDIPESNLVSTGPTGTEWAEGTTADLEGLTFGTWKTAVGGFPPGSVDKDYVVHLVEDDIYLDLQFLSWGQGPAAGGAFSYTRTTAAIPEPAGAAMLGMSVAALVLRRRRR